MRFFKLVYHFETNVNFPELKFDLFNWAKENNRSKKVDFQRNFILKYVSH